MGLTINDVIAVFGTASRVVRVAKKHGSNCTRQNIHYWQKHNKGELSKEKQVFFANVIKKEAEAYLALAESVLNGDGNGN